MSALDSFDGWSYLASHGDLITAFGADPNAAVRHYVVNGFNEGRALDSFDEWSYLASHGDLITAFGADPNAAVRHYVVNGFNEGRALDSFDEITYANIHPDLYNAFGYDREALTRHYVEFGFNEGRALADDIPGDTSTTAEVAIGGTTSGNLESPTDSDWFRISLVAGTTYTFRQNATTSGLDSLLTLRNASGVELVYDDDGGVGYNSLITFTPTTTGTYFLDASSYQQSSSGSYTVSAIAATEEAGWWTGGRFNELWGFNQPSDNDIDASEVFTLWGGPSSGILNLNAGQNIVAVLDTGIRGTHEDLSANYVGGYDFANGDDDPNDVEGHGTHVAGTIGAVANSVGVVGANPAAKLLAVKVLGDAGSGYTSDIIEGVNYSVLQGAKILNLSLGGGGYSQAFYDALAAAGNAGCLSIIAAGNSGLNTDIYPSYPASYDHPSIVSVAASDSFDSRAYFSNYGLTSVDLYAPGQNILSTTNTSDMSYGSSSGTSMAAPLVAGVVSAYWARNPTMTAAQIKERLLDTVDTLPFSRDTLTGGRLNMSSMFGLAPAPVVSTGAIGDSITGVSLPDSRAERFQSHSAIKDSESNGALYYNSTNVNSINPDRFKPTKDIIISFTARKAQRVNGINAIEAGLSRGTPAYAKFDSLEVMEGLGNGLGILTIDNESSHGAVLSSLESLLEKGLISGFELDSRWSPI